MTKWVNKGFGMWDRKYEGNHPRMGSDPHFGTGKTGNIPHPPNRHPTDPTGSPLIASLPLINTFTPPSDHPAPLMSIRGKFLQPHQMIHV